MARKTVAELLADVLAEAGVEGGDELIDLAKANLLR